MHLYFFLYMWEWEGWHSIAISEKKKQTQVAINKTLFRERVKYCPLYYLNLNFFILTLFQILLYELSIKVVGNPRPFSPAKLFVV